MTDIVQVDRDRAEPFRRGIGGAYDRKHEALIQAFAEHRLAALSQPKAGEEASRLTDWARRVMRFIDLCDADADGYDDLHKDAEQLTVEGYSRFGLDPDDPATCIAALDHQDLEALATTPARDKRLEEAFRAGFYAGAKHREHNPDGAYDGAVGPAWTAARAALEA